MNKFIFIFILLSQLVDAQHSSRFSSLERKNLPETTQLIQQLATEFEILKNENTTLKLIREISSPIGHHYTYQLYIYNIPVKGSSISINTTIDGKITSCFNELSKPKQLPSAPLQLRSLEAADYSYVETDEGLVLSRRKLIEKEGISAYEYYDATGKLLYREELTSFSKIDTVVSGYVFLPDPLTTANTTYGWPYIDNNDADATPLTAQLFERETFAYFDTDSNTFILESPYCRIENFQGPSIMPPTSTDGTFNYSRNNNSFEAYNAFYHINTYQSYIQSLGFTNLVNDIISVDVHGQTGDQSSYTSGYPGKISYGDGGVDDAEDGELILHEYAHAVQFYAEPNINSGADRQALNEGNSDLLATLYTIKLDPFGWQEIFPWDGHNEFWDGRTLLTQPYYQSTGDAYERGIVWASVVLKIANHIGIDTTVQILLSSLYSYSSGMAMTDAAELFMIADSALYGTTNAGPVCSYLNIYGFTDKVCLVDTIGGFRLGLNDMETLPMLVKNTGFFATGGFLTIEMDTKDDVRLSLFSISGQLIEEKYFSNQEVISLSSDNLEAGIYILNVQSGNRIKRLKLIRI